MSGRLIDIIIYGASGFTGKRVAKALYANPKGIRWAIAGRSQAKLDAVLSDLGSEHLPETLVADATKLTDLQEIFSKTKLVLNCTGPYRFLGSSIVEACITSGADYMDISGEPQFMESSFLNFHDVAKAKNVLILHACAFDSVPADMGCLFVMRQYPLSCCSIIESFLSLSCGEDGLGGHYTTYECAVHGFGDIATLKRTREEVQRKYQPPQIEYTGKKLTRKSVFFYDERVQRYAFPFIGADASVVRSSHRSLAMQSGELIWPQYGAYATVDSWLSMMKMTVYGGIFTSLASLSSGRSLLLSYPETFTGGIFSHKGPTPTQLQHTSFTMKFFAKGYLTEEKKETESEEREREYEREVIACVSGLEPGYIVTPSVFLALADELLEQREKERERSISDAREREREKERGMPKGGVYTPAAAFYYSDTVFERLTTAGLKFEVEQIIDKGEARERKVEEVRN
eukprot:CAMPEP_0182416502 /NCGR_PEP_ID=MMETSP1167-20130531/809_1 /TAXON_ID=2988 /ORGANISM="Mallomonas Sp, Strain CCMP3275" /LENGTH=458 /DNA_ID=CAMNT_0024589319 /DNA_START=53 /DNA_END=1426 /DNA_ORIENTATION=-